MTTFGHMFTNINVYIYMYWYALLSFNYLTPYGHYITLPSLPLKKNLVL